MFLGDMQYLLRCSIDSYNLTIVCQANGWQSCHLEGEVCFLKSRDEASRGCTKFDDIWVCTRSGEIVTTTCTYMAGQAMVCSHVRAVLWEVDFAAGAGMDGSACRNKAIEWNEGIRRNVEPATMDNVNIEVQKEQCTAVSQQTYSRSVRVFRERTLMFKTCIYLRNFVPVLNVSVQNVFRKLVRTLPICTHGDSFAICNTS